MEATRLRSNQDSVDRFRQPRIEIARIDVGGCLYDFQLTCEKVEVPDSPSLSYWNMDGSALREAQGGANGKAVVEFWWACQFEGGRSPDKHDLIHYLLARAHLRFAKGNSTHDIYRGTHLGRFANREYSLDPDESRRLRAELEKRGVGFMQGELEQLFLGHERQVDALERPTGRGLPDEAEMPAYDKAISRWVDAGFKQVWVNGRAGIEQWLGALQVKLRRYQQRGEGKQKQGTGGRVRRFINAFQYECLHRFHACVANAWVGIFPWLRAHQGLDTRSERFMALMHTVHTPTETEAQLGRRRGVLFGYSLALHPAGRWMLGRPEYLAAIDRWISRPDLEEICQGNTAWEYPEYRNALHAILCAAAEYDACRRQDESSGRPQRKLSAEARQRGNGNKHSKNRMQQKNVEPVVATTPWDDHEIERNMRTLFDALARSQQVACPRCTGVPRFQKQGTVCKTRVQVIYFCDPCEQTIDRSFAARVVRDAVVQSPPTQADRD
jgi:hypothetical protein